MPQEGVVGIYAKEPWCYLDKAANSASAALDRMCSAARDAQAAKALLLRGA
jgi:transposase-like protein